MWADKVAYDEKNRIIEAHENVCAVRESDSLVCDYVVITKYFTGTVAGRWKRTTVSFHVQSLRSFFRYASSRGWCVAGIAESIDAPRLYIRKSAAGPVVGRREEASCQRQRCVAKSDQKSLCDPALRGLRSSRWRSLSPAC